MADFSKVLGYNAQRNRYYNLLIDSNGSLNVNVVSSAGGGGVLDQATATNQISQLNQATASNAAICSLLSEISLSGSSNSIPTIEASNLAITQRQDESLTEIQALNNKFVAYNSNLNVFDSQSVEELVNLNYKLSEAQNGGLPFYVQIGSDDAIQILGYNPNDAMSESVNCINGNLQVNDHLVNSQLITIKNNIENNNASITATLQNSNTATNEKLSLISEQVNLVNVGIGEINGQLFNIDTLTFNIDQNGQITNSKLDLVATEGTAFSSYGELQSINGTSTVISNDLQNLNSIVSTETTLGLVKSELITLNNSDLAKDATSQSIDASLLFTNEKLDLVNTNLESSNLAVIEKLGLFNFDIDGNLKTTGSGGGGGGDATSANQISSNLAICQRLDTVNNALASTPGINTLLHATNAESPSDYLTLKATSTNGALLVQDILGPTADYQILSYDLQQFQSANAVASNLSICERLDTITVELESLANESTLQALEEKVITCNTDEVSIVNTPNVHCFGSSDGNNWHHILTTPQGKILVNSSTQDGNGENITSHIINTDRGLDTYIINPSIQVSNVWLPTLGSIDTKSSTINSSIGQTNAYLASQSIQLNDIIIEQQSTNTSLSTIESAVATIESTIGTATQKVSIYSASESPINATSNALNVYQTNNPTSTNITASDAALTATGSALNVNQTNNPTSINITANDAALNATSGALNSFITNPKITVMSPGSSALGSRGNLWNNASVAAQSSTVNLNVDEFTTSVISYEDTSTAATSDILVFGRAFGSGALDWQYLGKLIPILSSALSKRYAVGIFRLHQFAYIYLYNNSTTQALTNVYASVTSEYVA